MIIVDPGHIYDLWQLGTNDPLRISFIKRGGGAITYPEEWPGVQNQEVTRALIDRSIYLDNILPCSETQDAIYHYRMALWCFEARAHRRKMEKVNRKLPVHDDTCRMRPNRILLAEDVPFTEYEIEKYPIGPDGHILI